MEYAIYLGRTNVVWTRKMMFIFSGLVGLGLVAKFEWLKIDIESPRFLVVERFCKLEVVCCVVVQAVFTAALLLTDQLHQKVFLLWR